MRAVGGGYPERGFVVGEHHGKWGTAARVPGLEALNKGATAAVNSVWCAPAGNCAAVGDYTGPSGHLRGFVTHPS